MSDNLFLGTTGMIGRHNHFLHHLSDDTVRQDNSGVIVFESQIKTKAYEIGHLLYGRGCQGNQTVIAMATAFHGLEIISLTRLDRS